VRCSSERRAGLSRPVRCRGRGAVPDAAQPPLALTVRVRRRRSAVGCGRRSVGRAASDGRPSTAGPTMASAAPATATGQTRSAWASAACACWANTKRRPARGRGRRSRSHRRSSRRSPSLASSRSGSAVRSPAEQGGYAPTRQRKRRARVCALRGPGIRRRPLRGLTPAHAAHRPPEHRAVLARLKGDYKNAPLTRAARGAR